MHNQVEDENTLSFKLPQIGKKHFDVLEDPRLVCEKDSYESAIA